jgi:hypothetical protein
MRHAACENAVGGAPGALLTVKLTRPTCCFLYLSFDAAIIDLTAPWWTPIGDFHAALNLMLD